MIGPHPNKNYTAADIEQYHNGSMPAEEAHALERAALDDPFLSDAIDGYMHAATPAADIAFLKQQLQSRSGKVIAITAKKRPVWLRVAAMVALLAGLGWMVYRLSGKMEHDIAVQTNAAPQPKEESLPEQPAADSVSVGLEKTAATTQMRRQDEEKEVINKETVVAKSKAPEMMDQELLSSTPAPDTMAVLESAAAVPMAMKSRIAAKNTPIHTFKARVVDERDSPVPFALVTDIKRDTAIVADFVGTFSITAPDSTLTATVSAAGFQPQQIALHQNDSNTAIVLQRSGSQLQEVGVTAMGTRNNVRLEAVEPLQGWERLNAYVAETITDAEQDTKAPDGDVILSFDVDKRGNAIDIIVEKTLCPSCDSTAVRIIKENKWRKKNKTTRAKAHIRF